MRKAGLTGRQAACLAMRWYDGLGQREIARLLGMTPQAVGGHLRGARANLGKAGLAVRKRTAAPAQMLLQSSEWLDRLTPEEIKGAL